MLPRYAIEPSERETSEMQSNESRTELITEIKTEPTELSANVDPSIPRFTYSNRKKSNQTHSAVPVARIEASRIELQQSIKLERPDEVDEISDPLTCIKNHSQTQFPQNAERSCMRCSTLNMKETQLTADIDEFQKKCQLLQTENILLHAKVKGKTAQAIRFGQIIRYRRCDQCSSLVTAEQLCGHLCAGLTEIACEYCADAKFTSTLAMKVHLICVHANMKFLKCTKCPLVFRMNAFRKIHEKNHERADGLDTNTWYKCSKCDESSDQPLELVRHFAKCSGPSETFTSPERPKTPEAKSPEELKPLERSKTPEVSLEMPKPLGRPKVRKSSEKPIYECYICKCPLDCFRTVRKHLKQHATARDKKCEVCSKRFTSNQSMRSHICDSFMAGSQIACEYCDESFESVAKCMQHLKIAHANDRSMHQCRTCPRHFGMVQLRNFHERFYPHPTKPFECCACSKRWSTKDRYELHMMIFHPAYTENSCLCSECGKYFETNRSLQLHMALHKDPTIQCPDCPAKFHNKYTFRAHYQWHQNLTFKCNDCSRTYSTKKSLHVHMKRVHEKAINVRKYECSFCDLKFEKSIKLKIHMVSHTGERPFECEVCHKSYGYKGDLTKHMQTHVGDNIYKCDVCGRGFRYHADMKRHIFDHYKEDKGKHEAAQRVSTSVEK